MRKRKSKIIIRTIADSKVSGYQFKKESEDMIKKGKELMKIRKQNLYIECKNSEPIKSLFEVFN